MTCTTTSIQESKNAECILLSDCSLLNIILLCLLAPSEIKKKYVLTSLCPILCTPTLAIKHPSYSIDQLSRFCVFV